MSQLDNYCLSNPYDLPKEQLKSNFDRQSYTNLRSYDELESQATSMKIINNTQQNSLKKGTIPEVIRTNQNFTFGMRSDMDDEKNHLVAPGVFQTKKGASQMMGLL